MKKVDSQLAIINSATNPFELELKQARMMAMMSNDYNDTKMDWNELE